MLLGRVKLYSEPIYDEQYIKTKIKIFSEIIKKLLNGDKIPEERIEYACIACIILVLIVF